MKKRFLIYQVVVPVLVLFLISDCKKEEPKLAVVTTAPVTNITQTTASSGGTVMDDGSDAVINRGVTWSTTHNPAVGYVDTKDGAGTGTFLSKLSGLSGSTTYYVRAYATNSAGTGYGNEVSFKSNEISLATVTTTNVTAITSTTASAGGKIPSDGGIKVTEWGVCWSASQNPTIADQKIKITYGLDNDVVTDTIFTIILTGLTPGTSYFVRAYAVNSLGTTYGNQVSFIANPTLPALTTSDASITSAGAVFTGGSITSDGGNPVTSRGVCWSTSHSPTVANGKTIDGAGSGTFSSNIVGLTATTTTTYYVRAYATNGAGIAYGNEISFTENQNVLATLTTTSISDITTTSAVSGGNIITNGGTKVTDWGVCWSTSENPTTVNTKYSLSGGAGGAGLFTGVLADLTQGTTYFVRAYAVNSSGTAYGDEISFSTQYSVIISAIVSLTSTSAVVTGNIIPGQNGIHLIGSGVCWNTSGNPTTADSKTMNVTYSGIFTSNLTALKQGTTYFMRAYALYDNGPAIYGLEQIFTTPYEPGTGTQKADFPGGARYSAAGFSIGTKVYLGLGTSDGDNSLKDFWEWDKAINVWTRKADYPGRGTVGTVSFSIGIKGYIGTGETNEFWEYDPSTNTWSQKSSLPGSTWGRINAVGFSIGTKGYIGTGSKSLGGNSESRDFWEWDQATNVWTQKADFGGNARSLAVGFSIGNKGYLGTGSGHGTLYNDFWEWDQATNVWTQKADFAGTSRYSAIGFSIGNKGYIGTGADFGTNLKFDFWEWDQNTNAWTRKANFAGKARSSAAGFSIGNNGYIGTGSDSDGNGLNDFWEYEP